MTARWSQIAAIQNTDLIELEMRLVIERSSQFPCMNVGWKITMLLETETCEDFIECIGISS